MTNKYQEELVNILHTEDRWVKVHAAEFLIWKKKDVATVHEVYLAEKKLYDTIPQYRIGIWRVLYQASSNSNDKQKYLNKIIVAYKAGPDKLHALETLAKLKFPLTEVDSKFEEMLMINREVTPDYLYGLWNLYHDSKFNKEYIINKLIEVLESASMADNLKLISCYILRFLPLEVTSQAKIVKLAYEDWSDSVRLQFLVTLSSFVLNDEAKNRSILEELLAFESDFQNLPSIMLALSYQKDLDVESHLIRMYRRVSDRSNPEFNADMLATSAYAMLK